MLGISCRLYFFCRRISLTCGALLQSRQEKTKVLISVFPSFFLIIFKCITGQNIPFRLLLPRLWALSAFRRLSAANLAAVRTLIYEDTTAI